MKILINKTHIINPLYSNLVKLPTPTSISYIWNWGSSLGFILIIQIITGILLASHYEPSIKSSFSSVIHIIRDVDYGWIIRIIHINGASLFFILIFAHISRGIIFTSYRITQTWYSGTTIIILLIATAFLGYVLPWGQISFWGATVITNLISAIPYLGNTIVQWLWGGFSINQATLSRFFMLHFILPFILRAIVIIHLITLHITGSSNPRGNNPNLDKSPFHPYFSWKDILFIITIIILSIYITLNQPFYLLDPENYNQANPLNTPIHIQPEWYFLFAYTILRSIPNKLGGVVALITSILIILILPTMKKIKKTAKTNPIRKNNIWIFFASFLILTWIGANPVEAPYETIGKIFSAIYFVIVLSLCFLCLFWKQWKKIIKFFKKLKTLNINKKIYYNSNI